MGTNNGGANKSKNGGDKLIILPITQLQLLLSMGIAEVLLLSDPNYTFSIGSENYFSLAVGAFVGGIFIFILAALRVGNRIKFKQAEPREKILVKVRQN